MTDVMERPEAASVPALVEEARSGALLPRPLAEMIEVAEMMAKSGPMVPPAFQGHPDRCLAVVYQSSRWGFDPVAVCSQAYVTKDREGRERISYQAQLVHAVVMAHGGLDGPLVPTFHGNGTQRYCTVVGKLKGHQTKLRVSSPVIGQIKPRNSPLWFTDPDQQLSYYTTRAWCRRHKPDVLMGVVSRDEIVDVVDVTAEPRPKLDAYSDEPLEHVEVELVDEDAVADEPQEESSEPSGGASDEPAAEPEDMGEVRQAVAAKQAEVMALDDLEAVKAGYAELMEMKQWGRLKAYDMPLAIKVRDSISAHAEKLKGSSSEPS